jgi:2-dehydropantoate 2-reductase
MTRSSGRSRLAGAGHEVAFVARGRQFRDACADNGIDAETSDRIEQTIGAKFVFLVGLSGTTSLARSPIGPIRSNPRSRAFLHDVMAEVVQVALVQGVPLPAGDAVEREARLGMTTPCNRAMFDILPIYSDGRAILA